MNFTNLVDHCSGPDAVTVKKPQTLGVVRAVLVSA